MNRDLENILNRAMPANAEARLGSRIKDLTDQVNALTEALGHIYLTNVAVITAPVLTIKAGSSPTVKSSSAFSALAAGSIQSKNADTDMAALSGTVAAGKSALFIFYMSSAGSLTSVKTADADSPEAAVLLLPEPTANLVRLGYILVTNGTDAGFVGATTALDAADIDVTYVSSPAAPAFASAALATL